MLAWEHVRAAVTPLRMTFWGGLLWIFDLSISSTVNGEGFRFDLLDDTLGTVLITVGVVRLSAAPVGGPFRPAMAFVKFVAIASIVQTALQHFVFRHPAPLAFVLAVLALAQIAATILFCLAMKWFADAAALPRVARSWHVTLVLFAAIYALPLGLFYLASLFAITTGASFHINPGAGALLLLPVFAAPLVHLFVSTSRMKRAAAADPSSAAAAHAAPGGFPVLPPRPE